MPDKYGRQWYTQDDDGEIKPVEEASSYQRDFGGSNSKGCLRIVMLPIVIPVTALVLLTA